MTLVRIGIVGCGVAAETLHLPALARVPGARVVAVADIEADRALRLARRFHIPRVAPDHRAIVEASDVDAVAVLVPPAEHKTVAAAAIRAGKHVFIEKPLALSLEDCDQIVDAVGAARTTAQVGHNLRWHRLLRQARLTIAGGALGEIVSVASSFAGAPGRSPDVLLDLGVHHFDLWRFLLADDFVELHATRSGAGDAVSVMGRLARGATVTSLFARGGTAVHELRIHGTAGALRVSCYRFDGFEVLACATPPGGVAALGRDLGRALRTLPRGLAEAARGGAYADSYRAEWEGFVAAVAAGAPAGCTVADGRRGVEVALLAIESAARGAAVRVGPAA